MPVRPAHVLLLITLAALAACHRPDGAVARDAKGAPPLNEMVSTPGDWTALQTLSNRDPAESGLLMNSPIVTDLDAMLGETVPDFRKAMAPAGPLHRVDGVLVSLSPRGGAYLMIDDHQHALQAGLRQFGKWRIWRTPASEWNEPAEVRSLVGA